MHLSAEVQRVIFHGGLPSVRQFEHAIPTVRPRRRKPNRKTEAGSKVPPPAPQEISRGAKCCREVQAVDGAAEVYRAGRPQPTDLTAPVRGDLPSAGWMDDSAGPAGTRGRASCTATGSTSASGPVSDTSGSHPAESGRSAVCGLGRSDTRCGWRGRGSRSAAIRD